MDFRNISLNLSMIIFLLLLKSTLVNSFDWALCDQHVSPVLGEGTFSHLNHPFNHSQNLDCRIHIHIPEFLTRPKLCFNFKKFRLYESLGCFNDYLELPGLGSYCGEGWKNGVESPQNTIFKTLCIDINIFTTTLSFRTSALTPPDIGFYATFYVSNNPVLEKKELCQGNNKVACKDESCVDKGRLCDGVFDCPDASDESTQHAGCPEKAIFEESCSFEWGTCGFTSERAAWGRTTANPSEDHTTRTSDGFVMTTFGDAYGLAALTTPTIIIKNNNKNITNSKKGINNINNNNDDYCFSFWYRMHNPINHLLVNLLPRQTSSSSSSSSPGNILLLSRERYHGSDWTMAEIDLKGQQINASKVQFELYLLSTNTFTRVLSIDDVSLAPGSCYRGDISCTFELGLCGWSMMMVPSYIPWKPHTSTFGFYSYTDVEISYLRMNSSELGVGMKAVMISRPINVIPSSTACLSFKLFVNGPGSAFIRLNVSDQAREDRTIWSTKNRNSFDWKVVETPIYLRDSSSVMIKLEAFNRTSAPVVVGFDDVVLYSYPCKMDLPIQGPVGGDNWFQPSQPPTPQHPLFPLFPPNNVPKDEPPTTHMPMFCPSVMFKCQNGLHCIPLSQRCDGFVQCYDASDEFDCSTIATSGSSNGHFIFMACIVPLVILVILVCPCVLIGWCIRRQRARRRLSNGEALRELPRDDAHIIPPPPTLIKPPPYSFSPPPYEASNSSTSLAPKPDEYPSSAPPPYNPSVYI